MTSPAAAPWSAPGRPPTARRGRRWIARLAGAVVLLWLLPAPAALAADVELLGERSVWRFHVTHWPWRKPYVREWARKAGRWVRWGEGVCGPLPPDDWRKADFDDAGWPRRPAPLLGVYGGVRRGAAALVCARGRFGVKDPGAARGTRLHVRFRGGLVACVNGRELGRSHMPRGPLHPLTPAEDYPREAFVTPDGRKLLPGVRRRKPPKELADRYEARLRTWTADVPAGLLRKGTNVLALELHRADIPPKLPRFRGELNWNTVGLVALRLTCAAGGAVVPNASRPGGVQVWCPHPMLRVGLDADYADPFEPRRGIELDAPQNGLASGRAVVSAAEPLPPVEAAVSDLAGPHGAKIPSAAVRIRYARPYGDSGFLALHDACDRAAERHEVWVTVHVPADAAAGSYAGTLAIRGAGRPRRVPLRLTVYAWRLGQPKDWKTCVNLLQSPQSVAGHYKVKMWSDRHFELMGRSFALMGACGNDILGISAVGKSVFGNDPPLVFRRSDVRGGGQGGELEADLTFVRRYLSLYNRVAGRPGLLCLHVWNWTMYKRGAGRGGGDKEWRAETIPIVELRDGKLIDSEMPIYGRPGTEEVWRRAMDGLRDCVQSLGWPKESILLGTSADGWPHVDTVRMFRKVAPYARWRAITHGSGVPRWGPTDAQRTQPNEMVVGYLERVRRISTGGTHLARRPVCCNARDCVKTDPFMYRSLPTLTVHAAGYDGFCWKGIDYWPYTTGQGAKTSALNTYVRFGNIVGSTPRTIAAPGPNGAVATVQYETLREGIQDCEAMWRIRDALADPARRARLGKALAERCERICEEVLSMLETGARCSPSGGADVRRHVRSLYTAAAEVAQALAAQP